MTPKNVSLKTERLLALLEIKHMIDNPSIEDCEKAEEIRIMLQNRIEILDADPEDEAYIEEWARC